MLHSVQFPALAQLPFAAYHLHCGLLIVAMQWDVHLEGCRLSLSCTINPVTASHLAIRGLGLLTSFLEVHGFDIDQLAVFVLCSLILHLLPALSLQGHCGCTLFLAFAGGICGTDAMGFWNLCLGLCGV